MIVINNESRVRVIKGIFLFPSLNKISSEKEKILKNDPDFKYAVDKGNFTIKDETVKSDSITEYISSLSVKEGKQEIQEIYDIRKLKEIKENDSRAGIVKAVEKQLDNMEVE